MALNPVNFERLGPNIGRLQLGFLAVLEPRPKSTVPLPKWDQQFGATIELICHLLPFHSGISQWQFLAGS